MELLLRVVDKTHTDPYVDVTHTKRGDVVVVCPDGWPWGDMEKSNPDWRILKWPDLLQADAESLVSREIAVAPQAPPATTDRMLQARGFHLKLDNNNKLPPDMVSYLADSTRSQWFYAVPNTVTISDLKIKKSKRQDPNVIG